MLYYEVLFCFVSRRFDHLSCGFNDSSAHTITILNAGTAIGCPKAFSESTFIDFRADVAIVAGEFIVCVGTPHIFVADIVCAGVVIVAGEGLARLARPEDADGFCGTQIVVVTGNKLCLSDLEELFIVVPTISEAIDYIYMEELEKNL